MRVIFFGTSDFAVPTLRKLAGSGHKLAAVITQPDKRKGRNLEVGTSPVKALALSKNLKILQPDVPDAAFKKELTGLNADISVVVAYGHILNKGILEVPGLYSINLHGSLLPKYRGAAPINWAIINGETKTGVAVIKMNERMDEGDIILSKETIIEEGDTFSSLSLRLSFMGADLVLDALNMIEKGAVIFRKQSPGEATYARKLVKEDGIIDWDNNALQIHNKVRGTIPWPGAYTYFGDKKINVWKTYVADGSGMPGEVIQAEGDDLVVGTKKGLLKIHEIQLEGKKRMSTDDFLRGYRGLKKGNKFSIKPGD